MRSGQKIRGAWLFSAADKKQQESSGRAANTRERKALFSENREELGVFTCDSPVSVLYNHRQISRQKKFGILHAKDPRGLRPYQRGK